MYEAALSAAKPIATAALPYVGKAAAFVATSWVALRVGNYANTAFDVVSDDLIDRYRTRHSRRRERNREAFDREVEARIDARVKAGEITRNKPKSPFAASTPEEEARFRAVIAQAVAEAIHEVERQRRQAQTEPAS